MSATLLTHLAADEFEAAFRVLDEHEGSNLCRGLKDADGTPPLVLALTTNDQGDDEDEESETVDTASVNASARLASMIASLLHNGAEVDATDQHGRTPVLLCVLLNEHLALNHLLDHRPDLLLRPTAIGMIRASPLGAAFAQGSSEAVRNLMENAAVTASLGELATQERLAADMSVFMDRVISRADLLVCSDPDDDYEAACALAVLTELGISMDVGYTAGEASASGVGVLENPLEAAFVALHAMAPLVARKAWRHERDVSEADLEVLRSLHCMVEADGHPLLSKQPEPFIARCAGSSMWMIAPECHRFNATCIRPLQRLYSCGVPTEAALVAVASLGLPVVEMGCGTGYWAKLLRCKGVDVAAYDIRPPGNGAADNGAGDEEDGEESGDEEDEKDGSNHDDDDGECIFSQAHIPERRATPTPTPTPTTTPTISPTPTPSRSPTISPTLSLTLSPTLAQASASSARHTFLTCNAADPQYSRAPRSACLLGPSYLCGPTRVKTSVDGTPSAWSTMAVSMCATLVTGRDAPARIALTE